MDNKELMFGMHSMRAHPNGNFLKIGRKKSSLVAQMIKHAPAMQETQVRPLGQEDPLKKETATHSTIPDWEIHGQRSLAGCSP